jgi:dsRNA-specific ribonuclease
MSFVDAVTYGSSTKSSEEMKQIINDDDVVRQGDTLIFNPYNSLNKEITLKEVQTILIDYGVPGVVNNLDLYKRAFVHRSYTRRPHIENAEQNIVVVERPVDCLPLKTKSNERQEFLGDGVLELVAKYALYKRFPKENEGFMTEKKIAMVKNEAIGRIAYDMRLQRWLILSRNAEEKKTRTNLKKLGCLFESFIGALFLDFNKISISDEDGWFQNVFTTGPGFQMAQKFIEAVFERHVDWVELIKNDDNYKNILQVKIQKEFKVTPHYVEIEVTEEEGYHMGVFLCIGDHLYNMNISKADPYERFGSFAAISTHLNTMEPSERRILVFLGEATHKIKKKAEQVACQMVIQRLDV